MIGSQAIFLRPTSLYLPPYTTLLSWLAIGAHRLHPLLGGPARVAVEGDAWHQITTEGQDALPSGCLMLVDKRESATEAALGCSPPFVSKRWAS